MAAKAGAKGDGFLIAVNGTHVVGMSVPQALALVRGTVGTFRNHRHTAFRRYCPYVRTVSTRNKGRVTNPASYTRH